MRVIAISNLFPNAFEPGRSTFNEQHFVHLSKHVEIQLIAPVAWTSAAGRAPARQRALPELPGRLRRVTHPRFYFPPRVARGTYARCLRHSIAGDFKRQVRDFKPDVVYATWIYPDGLAAAQLAERHGLPVVLKAHGSDIHSLDSGSRTRGTRMALSRAEQAIAVSDDLRRRMIDLGADPETTTTVYNGVDLERFGEVSREAARAALGIDASEKMLLYVGNLKPVKGVDRLIAGFAQLGNPDLRLHIVGDGPDLQALRSQAQAAGVGDQVVFSGRRPHAEIAQWMAAADAVCLMSRNEGVPNVLLEAMAAGTPVVAAAVGGIPEIVRDGDNGVLVDPCTPDQTAAALAQLLGKPWDRRSVADSTRSFTWDRNAEQTLDVLERAISRGRDRAK